MKKISLLSIILICILMLSGCGGNAKIDLETAKTNIAKITLPEDSTKTLYGTLKEYPKDELKIAYGLDTSLMDEYLIYFSQDPLQAYMYAIIKPKDGQTETIKTQIGNFLKKYENKWTLYLPEQTAYVKNALNTSDGDYLIVIISTNNQLVLDAIKTAKK